MDSKSTNPDITTLLTQNKLEQLEYFSNETRYDLLKVKYYNSIKPLFLKIAKNEKDSLLLSNQYIWTKHMSQFISPKERFNIVKPIDTGTINDYTWLLTEFVSGTPFTRLNDNCVSEIQIDKPENFLEPIAEMVLFIGSVNSISMKGIDYQVGKKLTTNKTSIIEQAVKLSNSDVPNLSLLLKLINQNYKNLGKSNNHCDFTPLNLIITNDKKIILNDCDLANILPYKYYDVAEFYNRLYTRSLRPDLANIFLSSIIKKLKKAQIDKFLHNFLCLSAFRAIANFSEIKKLPLAKQKTRLDMAKEYVQFVVSKKIISI